MLRNILFILSYLLVLYVVFLIIDSFVLPSITAGTATKKVPNVVGINISNAEKRIKTAGLSVEITKEINNDKYPAGAVISQVPAANSVVKAGRYIYLAVSSGKEMINMPYLKGVNVRNARINLLKAGLELGKTTFEFNEQYGKDTIAWQSVNPGSKVAYGSSIDITVSKGSELQIKIPTLIGLSFENAKALIEESGLLVGNVDYRTDNTYIQDIVLEQSPNAGEITTPNAVINLILSK